MEQMTWQQEYPQQEPYHASAKTKVKPVFQEDTSIQSKSKENHLRLLFASVKWTLVQWLDGLRFWIILFPV